MAAQETATENIEDIKSRLQAADELLEMHKKARDAEKKKNQQLMKLVGELNAEVELLKLKLQAEKAASALLQKEAALLQKDLAVTVKKFKQIEVAKAKQVATRLEMVSKASQTRLETATQDAECQTLPGRMLMLSSWP